MRVRNNRKIYKGTIRNKTMIKAINNKCKHNFEKICDAGGKFKTGNLYQCNKCMKIKFIQEGLAGIF